MKENLNPPKQQQAIHDYLESLLMDIDESEEPQQAKPFTQEAKPVLIKPEVKQSAPNKAEDLPQHDEPKTSHTVVGLEKLVAEIPASPAPLEVEVKAKPALETRLKAPVKIKAETQVVEQAKTEVEPQQETESAVPEWAQTRFQCLLFKVSGLSLAVPLVKLNSVVPWDKDITHTPNQTDWYLGLIKHLDYQIKVIDTALLVMPENRREKLEADKEKRLSHILLVDDYKWGLACDCIGEVIWLTQDEIKWRKNKKTRAWLSGTSLEHLCAIMDTEIFAKMLN